MTVRMRFRLAVGRCRLRRFHFNLVSFAVFTLEHRIGPVTANSFAFIIPTLFFVLRASIFTVKDN